MRMIIWKYPIVPTNVLEIPLPRGAQVLHVGTQFDQPQIWCLVDPAADVVVRKFRIFGTGRDITTPTERLRYIDTFQMADGNRVWHLFEEVWP